MRTAVTSIGRWVSTDSAYDEGHNRDCGGAEGQGPFVDINSENLRLRAASQCIDSGNDGADMLSGIETDIEGNPRYIGIVDMGAYEYQ
jgi:hypothetical protein